MKKIKKILIGIGITSPFILFAAVAASCVADDNKQQTHNVSKNFKDPANNKNDKNSQENKDDS